MKKIPLLFLLTSVIIVYAAFPVYANQPDLPPVKITPESFYYPLKRITEKIKVNLYIDSNSKAGYYKDLVQTRMAELKYIVDKDYLDQVEKSTQRVSYQVGVLTDYVAGKKLNNNRQSLADLYKEDKIILEKLRDKYPANSSFWMLVQHVINSIDINLQKL
ncbi:MAG: Uncharacterized protein G01um10147_45 [Microgenomates group bacterium Gr01-1014_7]|nr:MAG: Uncharacterized protein G01um10147_45 [Microgenomates group bacterium Gr01-1014_7]